MNQFYLDYIPKLYGIEQKEDIQNVKDKSLKQLIADSDCTINSQEAYHLAYKIFNKMDCNIEQKTNTSESFYSDLEIFSGNKNDKFNSIFSLIDKSHCQLGKIMMQHRLSNPTYSRKLLNQNQNIAEILLDNTNKIRQIETLYLDIKNNENDTLWFWKEKNTELKELFSMVYFNSFLFRGFNKSEDVLKWYNYLKIIIYPVYGLISPLLWILLPYLASKYWIGLPFTFWQYCKLTFRSVTNSSLIKTIFRNVNETILKIAQYFYLALTVGIYLYNIYMTFEVAYNLNKIINMIHTKVNRLSKYIRASYHILDKMNQIIPCHYQQKIEESRQLFQEIWDPLFETTPTLISNKGKILKVFKQFEDNKHKLIYLMQYVAEVDTHLNVVNLVRHNGYHLVDFNHTSNTPYLNINGLWNPCIDKNSVVTNNIQIGGQIVESFENDKEKTIELENITNIDNEENSNDEEELKDNEENSNDEESDVEELKDSQKIDGNIVDLPNNIIITGPNAAGKSTFIKSVALSILLSQTLGIAPVKNMELSCFKYISTYLNIPDTKGEKSLFQAEMEQVAKNIEIIKNMKEDDFSFIIMDELFNSTNFFEGVSGAYAIGNKLSSFNNNITVLTTHYDYLTKLSNTGKYQNYHFDAIVNDDCVYCDYVIRKGKSNKGVALELLKMNGFDTEMSKVANETYQEIMKLTSNNKDNDTKNKNEENEIKMKETN
jgi:hypothetical protein